MSTFAASSFFILSLSAYCVLPCLGSSCTDLKPRLLVCAQSPPPMSYTFCCKLRESAVEGCNVKLCFFLILFFIWNSRGFLFCYCFGTICVYH